MAKDSNVKTTRENASIGLDYYKKTYLFVYNLTLFVGFLKVYSDLLYSEFTGTKNDDSVTAAALIIKLLTYTQLLESLHPILGLVPGGPIIPFIQVFGRLVVNHFLTDPNIRNNSGPYPHYLFIVWSSIEIFRYSFYALRVFKMDFYPIAWCRYSLFLPLYPMGGFCESQIVLATAKQYQNTDRYSWRLPNAANISFDLATFLKIYAYVLLGPTILHLMRHMLSQRAKQLKLKVA